MSKTDLVVCYAVLDGHARRLGQLSRQWSDKQAKISRVEHHVERILKKRGRSPCSLRSSCASAH